MSLETFKKLAAKLPRMVGQIAFGIGDIDSNPDMWKIFDHARSLKIVPNVTVNGAGITDEIAQRLASIIEESGEKACPEYILKGVKYVADKCQRA